MGFLEAITNWKQRKLHSDLKSIKVTTNGAFYMKSEDLFGDKAEALRLLDKLNRSVESRKKSSLDLDASL